MASKAGAKSRGERVRKIAVVVGVALLAGSGLAPGLAFGRPLDTAVCADLDKEKTALETAGVAGDLHLQPEDAKALAADKLQRIQRYVQISADVLFRCPIAVTIAPAAQAAPVAEPAAKPAKVADTTSTKPAPAKKTAAAVKAPAGSKAKKAKR